MDLRFSVEHAGLFAAAQTVLEHLGSVETRLKFGDAESMWHRQWAHRAAWLHGHLWSALGLAKDNQYPAAIAIVRVALEHHLIDRLMFLGTATVQTWTRGDVTVGRYEAGLDRRRLDDQDLVTEWSAVGTGPKRRQYRVVLRSPRSTDDATFSLSVYHFLTDDYDPTTPRDHQLGRVRRKFNGLDRMRESADRARAFWDNYWKLDRILENLEVSALLSERERLQVELHYSLLSGFVHATGYGYGTVQGRTIAARVPPSYDHYCPSWSSFTSSGWRSRNTDTSSVPSRSLLK